MNSCEYAGDPITEPRSHPWQGTPQDVRLRYYDFRREPGLVRVVLEDFRPWSQYVAIESFYRLVESLNGEQSPVETNDCAFSGPDPTECSGRLMLLFREIANNTVRQRIEQLKNDIHLALGPLDPGFEAGTIGTTVMPTRYLELSNVDDGQAGFQLMISFWAWGKDEQDTMAQLARLLDNLALALDAACESFSSTRPVSTAQM